MKLNFKLIVAALSLSLLVKSQNSVKENYTVNKRGCGTAAPSPEWDAWFNKKVEKYKESLHAGKTQNVTVTIPVIVHVIHGGTSVGIFPNISANQIRSQITVLNRDFAGNGQNVSQLANTGFSVVGAANTNITFCLAQLDPSGNPLAEPGIERINYNTAGWTNPAIPNTRAAFQSLMENTIKPNSIWDPTLYYNIWVTDVDPNTGILGYATFPGGTNLTGLVSNFGNASTDGIWVWARCFGNTGTLQAPYNFGRTAIHETGHWLGLRHIGGDPANPAGDCNATDFCDDTPPQRGDMVNGGFGQNYGSPSYPLNTFVCASQYGDMFMNFMDYTDDASNYMFTPDQNIRIQTALTEGFFRNQLGISSTTLCSGLPLADFLQDTIACINSGIAPVNVTSEGSPVPTYSWTVKPATGVTFSPAASVANPVISFPALDTYTITMVATNSIGVTSHTIAVMLEDCTSLKENTFAEGDVKLSPNPTSGQFNIVTGKEETGVLKISVYNTLGQVVFFKNYDFGKINIDMSNYPDGIYNVRINRNGENVVKKIILNK